MREQLQDASNQLFPTLKPGLLIASLNSQEFYLGEPTDGLYMPANPYLPIARACDGVRSTHAIAQECGLSHEIVLEFIAELLGHSYIELRTEVREQSGLDLLKLNYIQRATPELELYSWRAGVFDGGTLEIAGRKTFAIVILGENRLARALLANLQASGFSQSRILPRALNPARRTSPRDVCGILLKNLDIGRKLIDIHEEIIKGAALNYGGSQSEMGVDLAISTDFAPLEFIQRWMSEGIAHLQISQPTSHTLEIGPVVIPNNPITACLNCVRLHRRDHLPTFINLATGFSAHSQMRRELPTSSASFAAGVITSYICEFAAEGVSSLTGHSLNINLLKPLEEIRHHHWAPHPECGCLSSNAFAHDFSVQAGTANAALLRDDSALIK